MLDAFGQDLKGRLEVEPGPLLFAAGKGVCLIFLEWLLHHGGLYENSCFPDRRRGSNLSLVCLS